MTVDALLVAVTILAVTGIVWLQCPPRRRARTALAAANALALRQLRDHVATLLAEVDLTETTVTPDRAPATGVTVPHHPEQP